MAVVAVCCELVSEISLIQGKIQGKFPFSDTYPARCTGKRPLFISFHENNNESSKINRELSGNC
jgi:hypothetical protein